VTDDFGNINKQAGGSGTEHATTVVGSSKRQAQPPTDHFDKLLEETCPNPAYPIKHKLRDCGMMKSFMASGSLSRDMEVDKVPNEGDAMPFPREDAAMTIYNGRPSPGMRRTSNPSLGTPTRCGWGCKNGEMYGHKLSCILYVEI
jgi:hypothetical protein